MESSREHPDPEELLAQSDWVVGLARRLVRDRQSAEDLAQETWVAALERGPRAEGGRGLRAWLARVLRTRAARLGRDEGLRREHERAATEFETAPSASDPIERMRLQRDLAEAVLALPDPYREAVVLRHLEGVRPKEIARRQGVSDEVARQRIARGLAKLRVELDRTWGVDRESSWSAMVVLAGSGGGGLGAAAVTLGGTIVTSKLLVGVAASVLAAAGWIAWNWDGAAARVEIPRAEEVAESVDGPGALEEQEADGERIEVWLDPAEGEEAPSTSPGAVRAVDVELDLYGTVFDENGEPVPGALVTANRPVGREYSMAEPGWREPREVVVSTKSDEDGDYSFRLAQGVRYDISAKSNIGAFRSEGRWVRGIAESRGCSVGERVDLHLERSAGLQLEIHAPGGEPIAVEFKLTRLKGGSEVPSLKALANTHLGIDGLLPGKWIALGSARGKGTLNEEFELHPGRTTRVVWELKAAEVIVGVVRDAETHAPLAGVRVFPGLGARDRSTTTDARGQYRLVTTLNGRPRIDLRALPNERGSAHSYASRVRSWDLRRDPLPLDFDAPVPIGADPEARRVDFELDAGLTLRGRVVDMVGNPIEGVLVSAVAAQMMDPGRVRPDPGSEGTYSTEMKSAFTDAQGEYRVSGLRADLHHALRCVGRGFGTEVRELGEPTPGKRIQEVEDIVLLPGALVHGQAINGLGEPVPRLRVELVGASSKRHTWLTDGHRPVEFYVGNRVGTTDSQGRFAFADVAPGSYWVEDPGDYGVRGPAQVSVQVLAGEAPGALVLRVADALELSGFVTVEGVGPVSGLQVLMMPATGSTDMRVEMTDADGEVCFEGILGGTYILESIAGIGRDGNGFEVPVRRVRFGTFEAGTRGLELVVGESLSVEGVLVDARGEPVQGGVVSAVNAAGERVENFFTGVDGAFSLQLEPGIAVRLEGYRPPKDGAFLYSQIGEYGEPAVREGVLPGVAEIRLVLPDS